MSYDYPHPVSRTHQYKKVTKPLLERKRRARINRCLEELKDLMIEALETEGENISKLEKADILELTVRHLQRLQATRPAGLSISPSIPLDPTAEIKWRSGFGQCAAEACRFLSSLPGETADRLARHLASGLKFSSPRFSPELSRASLVSPTLENLERTANIIAPCQPTSSSIEASVSVIVEQRIMSDEQSHQHHLKRDSMSGRFESIRSPYSRPSAMMSPDNNQPSRFKRHSSSITKDENSNNDEQCEKYLRTKADHRESRGNDEEEIDVVKVDNNNCDPMWRPW